MSITRLHNTDRLQALIDTQNRKREDTDHILHEITLAKQIAHSADKRTMDQDIKINELVTRMKDSETNVKTYEQRLESLDTHIDGLTQYVEEMGERQNEFDKIVKIICDDHERIDELLGSIHTGATPRNIPLLDTKTLEVPQRDVATDGTVTMSEEKPDTKPVKPPSQNRSSVKARVVNR